MIGAFSSWAKGIVIAVVISTIIELILPNGSSKKYVRSVIGIYILFVIISPLTNKITKNIDVNSVIADYVETASNASENYEKKTENNSNKTIKDIYISNLQQDIKKKLEEKGYTVDNSVIKIKNDDTYDIEKIKLYISNSGKKREEIKVNTVVIEEQENTYKLNEEQQNEVKEIINQNYGVAKENIEFS